MKKHLLLSIVLVGLLYSSCSNLAVDERSGFQGTGLRFTIYKRDRNELGMV